MEECNHECENRLTKLESIAENQQIIIDELQARIHQYEKQSRSMAIALFGDKKANIEGMVEQMSECKSMAEDFKFWKRFVTVSISIGAGLLFILRFIGLDKIFKRMIEG